LVERNLAKVEVESSRLFSRSRFLKGSTHTLPFCIYGFWRNGRVVMQRPAKPCTSVRFRVPPPSNKLSAARVVKLVDTADLKSAANLKRGVPVRFRSRAPILVLFAIRKRGRVVDCTGLENRQRATVREFESHRFRQRLLPTSTCALTAFRMILPTHFLS
jgi:hypothetical protein